MARAPAAQPSRSRSSAPRGSPVTTGAGREVDLPAYAASGLPSETMGRDLAQDPLFFGAALAGGAALAELAARLESVEGA